MGANKNAEVHILRPGVSCYFLTLTHVIHFPLARSLFCKRFRKHTPLVTR